MSSNKYSFILILFIIAVCPYNLLQAQIDSSYIQAFDQDFSARIYVTDKIFSFGKENEKNKSQELTLKTNNPVSVGLGVSWKNFSFSFSKGFDFFRRKHRGKTKTLEFQHHGYGRKFVYDLVLQQHQGFYNEARNEDKTFTIYPEMEIHLYGGSLQYVLNNKRFSYKAAFNQNERQMKSAGSLLLGGSLYYSKTKTDSTEMFEELKKNHEHLQLGLSVGYAYTWVIDNNWFLTGSVTTGASIGNNYPGSFFKHKMKIVPIAEGRFAAGYNAYDWSIGISSNINKVFLFYTDDESLGMTNGLIKLTFIKRFNWGNKFVNDTLNKTKKKLRL